MPFEEADLQLSLFAGKVNKENLVFHEENP